MERARCYLLLEPTHQNSAKHICLIQETPSISFKNQTKSSQYAILILQNKQSVHVSTKKGFALL